jgi:hypothetical protein
MATRTLDLLEAPRGQAAYRPATACPCCGVPLGLRQHRQTEPLLTGCSAQPGCPLTEPHDPRVQALGTGIRRAVQTRAPQSVHVQTEAQRQGAAERATLDRTVPQLMTLAQPDCWSDTPLAHELTVALVAPRSARVEARQTARN